MLGQHTLYPDFGARKTKKRLGRGNGSGLGTFSGRGCKGQKARSGKKLKPWFEGGQTPMAQRMPQLRGFKNINHVSFQVVNVQKLAKHFAAGETVDVQALYEKNLISSLSEPVKLLAQGEISHGLQVFVDAASQSAQEKIVKAGGTCTTLVGGE